MRLANIVARLKAQCPILRQALPALAADVTTSYPSAYVLPLAEHVSDDDLNHALRLYEGRFAVEIMVRNVAEHATGGPAGEALEDVREEVLAALVGWSPASGHAPIAHTGGRLVSFDAGIAVWRDEFDLTFTR